jgi:fluoride exporter
MTALLVAIGAAIGAPLRYLVDRMIGALLPGSFPLGILVVNVLGSFAFGLLFGAARMGMLAPDAVAVLGTGLCGSFTTYSAFAYDTASLIQHQKRFSAVLNVLTSVGAGSLAAIGGLAVAGAVG